MSVPSFRPHLRFLLSIVSLNLTRSIAYRWKLSVFHEISIHRSSIAMVQYNVQTRSMCLPRVCPLLVTAPFLWLQHVCGTVCRPLSHRRHRCWLSRDDSRRNCLLAVIQTVSCGYIWHLFFFFPHRSHVSLSLFFFVRCPRSLWHYATLISSFNNNNNNNNNNNVRWFSFSSTFGSKDTVVFAPRLLKTYSV